MKIGIDIRALDESKLRGIGKYLNFLLKYITEKDRVNSYVLYSDSRASFKRALNLPSNFKRSSFLCKGDSWDLWQQIGLPWHAKKQALDLLHCPGNVAPLWPLVPVVVTLHDVMMLEEPANNFGNAFYLNSVFAQGIRKAKVVITVSHYSKQRIIELLKVPEEKIEVVYHGVDPIFHIIEDKRILDQRLQQYLSHGEYIFCIAGNTKRKNTGRMIAAYILMRERSQLKHKLFIVGVTKNREKLLENVPEGIKSDIVFLPYLSEEDLICFYNEASLTVYPSYNEGFGFPILEAMACGSPVLTSDRTSLPEIGGNAAFYMDPFNINSIKENMEKVLFDVNLRSYLVRQGLERVKCFDWRETAQKTLDIYQKACR